MATTDPQDEQLTQVDEKNQIVGSISRKTAHESGDMYYRTIYVVIKNERNEILIEKRSGTKDLYPNCWDISVGGHVDFGKSYEETAVREVKEEMGLEISEEDLIFRGEVLVRLPRSKEYFHVYEYRLKRKDKIVSAETEIAETRWMAMNEIKKSMVDKTMEWYARPEQVIAALY